MSPTNPRIEIATARPRQGGVVLASVLVLCVLVLSAQAPARGRPGSVLQSWVLSATAPLARATLSVSRAVSGTVQSVGELFSARSENTRLRRQLAWRDRELFRLRAEAAELERHRLLAAVSPGLPRVVGSAPVLLLARRAGLSSALIAMGTERGAQPGSPIAVPEGLVGRIVNAGRALSRAQLLLDASAAVGARIARSGEIGVVRGDGHGGLTLNNIPNTSRVDPGDLVESAGVDGIYPRGIPIGRVESVTRGPLFLAIRIRPAARFSHLSEVLDLAPSPAAEASGEEKGAGR
jgi:rod shape-determining protein MreC